MITSNTKTSAVVVTAPRPLTKEQRETIRVEVGSNLPADVGVIVLDPGFAIAPVGVAPILLELRKIRLAMEDFRSDLDVITMGTARARSFLGTD